MLDQTLRRSSLARRLVVSLCVVAFSILGSSGVAAAPRALPSAPQDDAATIDPETLYKAIDQWLKAFEKDALYKARRSRRGMDAKDLFTVRHEVLDEGTARDTFFSRRRNWMYRRLTWMEIEWLCEQARAAETADAANKLLQVAAVGFDRRKYATAEKTVIARAIAEASLAKLQTTPARDAIVAQANDTRAKPGMRVAALRALGAYRDEIYRPHLEQGLADDDVEIRVAAAVGIRRSKLNTAVLALADALFRETDGPGATAILDALRAVAGANADKPDQHALRRAATSALEILGKHGWSTDVAVLAFVEQVRSADAVPALIAYLRRYAENPGDVKSGHLSGRARALAHELLQSLSGAVFPVDRVDQWTEWWDAHHDDFKVAIKSERSITEADSDRTAGSFFGIPVRGTRVVFVVDLSGSMNYGMPRPAKREKGQRSPRTKLDLAKRELAAAVDKLAADSKFNVITFNVDSKAWKKGLVPATAGNKRAFKKYLDRLRADGGTNLWAGLRDGLKIKSFASGDRYESNVDELFILSDGLPSVGDIVRPNELLRTVQETNQIAKVRLNTVYIVGDAEEERRGRQRGGGGGGGVSGPQLMKRLAEQNGGRFIQP